MLGVVAISRVSELSRRRDLELRVRQLLEVASWALLLSRGGEGPEDSARRLGRVPNKLAIPNRPTI